MRKRVLFLFVCISICAFLIKTDNDPQKRQGKANAVIDRITDENRVVILFTCGSELILSIEELPEEIEEGTWLIINGEEIRIDKKSTELKTNSNRRLNNELQRRKRTIY